MKQGLGKKKPGSIKEKKEKKEKKKNTWKFFLYFYLKKKLN